MLAALADQIENFPDDESLMELIGKRIALLAEQLSGVAYPFEHTREEMTLSHYIVALPEDPSHLGQLFEASRGTLERFYDVYFRIAGRLAATGLQLEESVGLIEPTHGND